MSRDGDVPRDCPPKTAVTPGEEPSTAELTSQLYDDLRRIAARLDPGAKSRTLQPTAVVNEAFVRLVQQDRQVWQNRAHFIAVASGMIRNVLVDSARARSAQKRGGGAASITIHTEIEGEGSQSIDILDLDAALERLRATKERLFRLVELRFFGGLTLNETAEVLGVSKTIIVREWTQARTFLKLYLSELDDGEEERET